MVNNKVNVEGRYYMNVTDEDRGKRRKDKLLSPPYTKSVLQVFQSINFCYVEVNMLLKVLDCLTVIIVCELQWTHNHSNILCTILDFEQNRNFLLKFVFIIIFW